MRPGGSKAKGAQFEREVAYEFRKAGYLNAQRGLGQARGAQVCDVEGTPWWIECKRYRKITKHTVRLAVAQACRDKIRMGDLREILVIHRSDRERKTWVVEPHFYPNGDHRVTPLSYFLEVNKYVKV